MYVQYRDLRTRFHESPYGVRAAHIENCSVLADRKVFRKPLHSLFSKATEECGIQTVNVHLEILTHGSRKGGIPARDLPLLR